LVLNRYFGIRDPISAGIAGEAVHKRIKGGGGDADELGQDPLVV